MKEKAEILWYLLRIFQEWAITKVTVEKYRWKLRTLSWDEVRNKVQNIVAEYNKLYSAYGCTEFPINSTI